MNGLYMLTKELCEIPAAAGREHTIAKRLAELAAPYADEWYLDRVGNLVTKITGAGADKKKILYAAHMDEVSVMACSIGDDGYVRFTKNGYPDITSLCYREVVSERGVHGMLVPDHGCEKDADPKKCYIDLGVYTKKDAAALVSVGDTFTAVPSLIRLGESAIAGRPIDDRIGCAVQLLAAKELYTRGTRPYHDVYFVYTVQEELSVPGVGASVACNEILPDIGLAVDVCDTGDVPGAYPMDVKLGGGAAILVRDTSMVADRGLVETLMELAKEKGIPYQLEVSSEGGVDAVPMQKAGLGAKASVLSIPMRYLHTSAETADLRDALGCVTLAVGLADKKDIK